MKLKSQQAPVDRMFRAFSDRTRLRILHMLRDGGELCVCDLVKVIGAPWSGCDQETSAAMPPAATSAGSAWPPRA